MRNLIGSSVSEYPAVFTFRQNKMASHFVSVTEENFFLINEAAVQDSSKKATKFGYKLSKDMYFVYFLAINALKMCWKCFVYKWWVGDKPTFRKIVLKI